MSAVSSHRRYRSARPTGEAFPVVDERAALREDRRLLAASGFAAGALWVVALLEALGGLAIPIGPSEGSGWSASLDFVVFGALVLMLPYGIARLVHLRRVDAIERRLPEFLEDVAESGSFGLTLAGAIQTAAKGHYGPLSAEIRRMATQIAWGVAVPEALRGFAERVPTPRVRQAVAVVIRADVAGGDYPEVLRRVAHATRADQMARMRRRSSMTTYVTVVYLAFFVFLLTIYVLAAVFLPQMLKASGAAAPFGVGGLVGVSVVTSLFLALTVAVLVHGVGDGLVSGLLYQGRWVDGLPHAAILLAIGWFVMRFVVPPLGGAG